MLLELDLAGRLLFGKHLSFEMSWSVNDSILTFTILTGCPIDAAQSAMDIWGDSFEYRLVRLDEEYLHVWTSDGATFCNLRRESALGTDTP